MKTFKKTITLMLTLFVFLIFSGCSTEEPGSTDTYIPDLGTPPNQWVNTADPTNNFFFLNVPPAGSASGVFDANSDGGANPGHLTGKYDHSSIEFTFDSGNYSGRKFSGKINGSASPVTMTLTAPAAGTNPAVTLTLRKV